MRLFIGMMGCFWISVLGIAALTVAALVMLGGE